MAHIKRAQRKTHVRAAAATAVVASPPPAAPASAAAIVIVVFSFYVDLIRKRSRRNFSWNLFYGIILGTTKSKQSLTVRLLPSKKTIKSEPEINERHLQHPKLKSRKLGDGTSILCVRK